MKAGFVVVTIALALAGCRSSTPEPTAQSRPGDDSALSTMERIAVAAQRCWFRAGDPRFAGLTMSPELTSHSGKPRILAVPQGNIGGLPKLVVEASGSPAKLNAFGPMMDGGAEASRISSDVTRWASGTSTCSRPA
ncbi:hypothetical protein [Aliihoeflea sp. 40Bstr573]|uniref:hypothetical protein n=1 Tax=Aliihoeflea sp. 40Bstr573 TaxID=2696467 RepID=UPI0020941BF3|nr:hypothetical protein [Aliihoeflea sp. 40Bstr573]